MPSSELRLGFIYPAGSGDQEYYQFADEVDEAVRILMLSTRLWGDDKDHDIESLLKTGGIEQLASAGEKFTNLSVDSVMWACTSGSFVGGVAWARDQARAIEAASGAPSSVTSLAIVEALRALGVRRLAIMASYPAHVAARLGDFLTESDFEVVNLHALDIISGWDAGRLPAATMQAAIQAADRDDAEAIVVPDTAIPTLHYLSQLEAALDKPVVSANLATLWKSVRLANSQMRPTQYGRLWAI